MNRKKEVWKRSRSPNWHCKINGKVISLGTTNRQEALRKYRQMVAVGADNAASISVPEPMGGWFYVELADVFLQHVEDHYRDWYLSRIKPFVQHAGERLLLSQMKPAHVTAYLAKHPDWSSTYKAGVVVALKRSINWHVEQGTPGVTVNPIAKFRGPKRVRREFVFDPETLAEFLLAIPEPCRSFASLCAATGCRPSEVANFRGTDVAADAKVIWIRKSKTGVRRCCPVPAAMRPIVRRWADQAGDGLLLTTKTGSQWSVWAWMKPAYRARLKLGLPQGATMYALRHTFITERLIAGESVADVATATGTSIAMISSVYAHLSAAHTEVMADRM